MDYEQMDLFEGLFEKPSLPKHIRLIEFFAGVGAQHKALTILGADFEPWRTCEWSWQSITAYNVIHLKGEIADTSNLTYEEVLARIEGVSNDYNKPMTMKQLKAKKEKWARELLGRMISNNNFCPNVSQLHAKDLDIRERESHTYILTYSFPCQDLSNAGLLKGMEKGSGTRSGLLWEVERILGECKQDDTLPQVLVMENVPNVCGSANIKPWNEWLDKLHSLGYTSYYRILNAKDFGIPQNRKRCFMVSILGEYSYSFPKKQPLEYALKDFLEKKADESYYLSEKWVRYVLGNALNPALKDFYDRGEMSLNKEVAYCLNTKIDRRIGDSNYITDDHKEIKVKDFISSCNENGEPTLLIPTATSKGYMEAKEGDGVLPNWKNARGTVQQGGCPTIMTNPDTIGVVVKSDRLRIRKLTEGECYRLMGFEEKDTNACKEVGQPKATIYHQAGDSIVTTCLVALFGELFGFDYEQAIKDHADKLHKEVEG